MADTYRIVRKFFKGEDQPIREGVTLEEAQVHCSHPETSSSTASAETLRLVGKHRAPWFDAYYKEN